jgi:3-oxoacyl-[acyl-carrier protein] reductase
VNYASDRDGADRVVEKIKTGGQRAIAVQGSVTSSEEIDRFFKETEKQLGNVDVLVNNAGVFAYLPLQDVNESLVRGICGQLAGSGLRLSEEAVEFAAGGIEGTLLVFRTVMNERAAVLVDRIAEQPVRRPLSERRVEVQVPDDFSTQQPKIVHMAANGLRGKSG